MQSGRNFAVFAALCGIFLAATACGEKSTGKSDTAAAAQADVSAPKLQKDEAFFDVPGGRIWYKTTGDGKLRPVILLHGGPGFPSLYMRSMDGALGDRIVVRYDQLGAGKSTHISDTTMFTIGHFVAELDSLRSHLGFDKVHLVGHSWGTILAVEYYRLHPEHVISLTLAGAALDIPAWEKHARDLVKTLPDSEQKIIAKREAEKNFEAPDYQNALMDFYGRYVWRNEPAKADLDSVFSGANQAIYNYMQGPSEFTITGTLRPYNSTDFIKKIKVPTLYIAGEFDEANPATVAHFATLTPKAKFVVIKGAAHMVEWDAPAEFNRVIRKFLDELDGKK